LQRGIIANERLGAALARIQANQQERDRHRMASPILNELLFEPPSTPER
jgi:hypothetical protein